MTMSATTYAIPIAAPVGAAPLFVETARGCPHRRPERPEDNRPNLSADAIRDQRQGVPYGEALPGPWTAEGCRGF